MTPDLQQEFNSLSSAARQLLKEVPASGSYRRVFSFWVMPSFSPSCRWVVYSPRPLAKGKKPFASYSTWRSDLDWEKFRNPVERMKYPTNVTPTIEEEVIGLGESFVEGIKQRLCNIPIPVVLSSPTVIGCDGTSFEFVYDESFFGAALHWWENQPEQWQPFTKAVMQIASDLDAQRKRLSKGSAGSKSNIMEPINNRAFPT